jgi:hypothetical protein
MNEEARGDAPTGGFGDLSDCEILDGEGEAIEVDVLGPWMSFLCEDCGHPVLAAALPNLRGSDPAHPAICRACGHEYFLDLRWEDRRLYVCTPGHGD